MYLEEINAKGARRDVKIKKIKNKIRKKEDDYEDMRQAKDGLSRVEEAFQSKKQQHQNVFNNVQFQRNRCLQRLSASMTGHLTGNTTSVSSGISDVDSRMSKLFNEISDDEQKLDRYLNQLSNYRAQARTAVSKNAVEG